MTDNEKLSCLIDRPCTACKFHKENGCSKWSCVFEEKSDDTENDDISHIFDNVTQEEFEKIAKELTGWDTEKIRKKIQGETE